MQTPSTLSWKTQADCGNIYNTPNIFSIWALECITADLLAKGGLVTAGARAKRRADLVSASSTHRMHVDMLHVNNADFITGCITEPAS